MEGDPEGSEDDVEGQDGADQSLATVLWEQCIQQSIFVDLSEDESLHLSDLESSFAAHLSQQESAVSEASIHFSGSAELSALEDSSPECSSVSSHSERVVEGKAKSSTTYVSVQRPNTMQNEPPSNQWCVDPGQSTSDEDQEDLPYDGNLSSTYFNHTASPEGNLSSEGRETLQGSPGLSGLAELSPVDRDNIIQGCSTVQSNAIEPNSRSKEENTNHDSFTHVCNPTEDHPQYSCPAEEAVLPDMTQLLLRHFSEEELLDSCRLIEAETLPEVSLLESSDETLRSSALTDNRTESQRNLNSNKGTSVVDYKINQSLFQGYIGRTGDKSNSASEISASLEQEGENTSKSMTSSDSNISNAVSINKQDSVDSSASDLIKKEKPKEDGQVEKVSLVRTRSFSELKYGQGQVHYPLPDFSKVAPKVKIPKTPGGPTRTIAQPSNTMHRAQSSPGMLQVISKVLEDSIQPSDKPYVFKDHDKQADAPAPALVHHLQAEYDKLLTKYAEAENLIDQMRLGTKTPSDLPFELDCGLGNPVEGSHFESLAPPLPPTGEFDEGPTHQSSTLQLNMTPPSSLNIEGPSDGERMTTELTDIISQFMKQVEEFKVCLSSMSACTTEQQAMLRSMMEAQDQLERKYISKKEEHRALEMQNYMGLSRNTGTFDPDRLLEGDIFRIGMHLEDIKDTIDKNLCEQLSTATSSSTPTPMFPPPSLSVKPSTPGLPTPSPPQSQFKGPSARFSTVGCETERSKELQVEKVKEVSEVHQVHGIKQSSGLITSDSLLNNSGHSSSHSRSLQRSLERPEIATTEDEEEEERSSILSEEIDHDNVFAYLTERSSSPRLRQQAPGSISTQDSAPSPESDYDLGAGTSLAVEVSHSSDVSKAQSLSGPALSSASTPERNVSPETDSGFGSSDLGQPATGIYQPKLLAESAQPQNHCSSGSESEGSCSNLLTAVHPAVVASTQRASPQLHVQTQPCGAGTAVELWVESTTKGPPMRPEEPVLSSTMGTPQRDSNLHTCSCNSDAIFALQSEVLRLKKDLEEGLVQLPHLMQRMDYLASEYRQDRQGRRAKIRPRTHHKLTSHRLLKIEDWISSDMDPSKSRATDSGDTDSCVITLQVHSTPVGGRRGSTSLLSGAERAGKPQDKRNSSKGLEVNSAVKTSDLANSSLKMWRRGLFYNKSTHRILSGETESMQSKGRLSPSSSSSHQKPLLQVNYGSSCSLPASYKVREPPAQSAACYRKHSTQSDTALLPSNVYFQRTMSPDTVLSKTGSRARRHRGSKEQEMSRTLDRAIEVARSMKRTTDCMAKSLSADLAKTQVYRKLRSEQLAGGRTQSGLKHISLPCPH
ncbi:microtubule organization protein AKNA-like [Lampris incognitus]|uniref:microtubule organization protein AKNA-like n=1 Tax=Lampris incognitus TaxID=2546036 RepID=UPI0024B4F167|nr:microtubule organization protein AKNA-like [Lampris incognitus]